MSKGGFIGILIIAIAIMGYFLWQQSQQIQTLTTAIEGSSQNTSTANQVAPLDAQNVQLPAHTQEYRNSFVNSCGDGIYYCTCLYDYLSQSYSDQQISALDIPNPNNKGIQITDPELVNAITACNQRFN